MAELARGDGACESRVAWNAAAAQAMNTTRRTSRIASVLGLLILSSASCADPTGLAFPEAAVERFEPPQKYALWWQQVEACAGRRADFSRVQWYRTIGNEPLEEEDGTRYGGYWWAQGNRIALRDIHAGGIVRHEMLHAILQNGKHPLSMFAGRCAGIVSFEEPEGYGASPADIREAVTVPAQSALHVTVGVDPMVPSASLYGGAFSIVVTATNRLDRPVWIAVPDEMLGLVLFEDSLILEEATSAQRVLFLPNQSRSLYADWGEPRGGAIRVRGFFLGVGSEATTIQVAP